MTGEGIFSALFFIFALMVFGFLFGAPMIVSVIGIIGFIGTSLLQSREYDRQERIDAARARDVERAREEAQFGK